MIKIKLNRKNIRNTLICLGVSGSLAACALHGPSDMSIQKESFREELSPVEDSYVNDYSDYILVDDFANEFDSICQSSESIRENWENIYPELYEVVKQYGEYLDQEEVLKSLQNLKFSIVDQCADSSTILARYDFKKNQIYYTKRLFNKKSEEVKELQLHESIHFLFQQNLYLSSMNLEHRGLSIDEGVASLIVRESGAYAGVDVYEKDVTYTKVIIELIGFDHFMEAVGSHNFSLLKQYLSEYCSPSEASNLIKYMDKAVLDYRASGTEEDIKAWKIINSMYVEKHGISIEDSNDEIMKIYSNKLLGTSYPIYGAKYWVDAVANKNYFFHYDDNSILLRNSSDGEYGKVILDANNAPIEVIQEKTK